MSEQLERTAAARFAELEHVVEQGLATFVDVGAALLEIRDGRLYRQTHGSFDDYCADRWGFTGRRGRQLMAAAEVGTLVPVATERQARELAPLLDEPELLREAWSEVAGADDPPTAGRIRDAVERTLDTIAGEPGVLQREVDARAQARAAVDAAALIRAAAALRPQHVGELFAAARLSTSTSTLAEQARAGAMRLEQLADLLERSSRPRLVRGKR